MGSKLFHLRRLNSDQKGSLALEQILFIGAIVGLVAGLYTFYGNLSNYFSTIGFASAPTNLGSSTTTTTTND